MKSVVGKSVENEALPSCVLGGRRFRRLCRAGFPAVFLLTISALSGVLASAQVNVTTFQNDIGRTGQNLNETVLTLSNVNSTTFGKLFSQPVDGQVYAQPLYLSGITVGGATHNVVFVATENDSVYAFDADSNGGTNSSPLWKASMLTSAHGAASGATTVPSSLIGSDIQPQAGITGTPVIDPTSGTLYVVSKTMEGGQAVQRLHALDVTTGLEKFNGPVTITASVKGTGNGSVSGTLTFDPLYENQRPALLLLNGIVYVGFASHGDGGPWHGWILAYKASTLAQTGAFCPSPNGTGAGFWMSGAGLAADLLDPVNKPYGRMFVPTGNGDFNATTPYTSSMDFGDSVLNLDLTNGVPTVTDDFTPYLQSQDDAEDGDVGSGGLMVIPTQTTGSVPHLAVQTGKNGYMALLNRENLGGYSTSVDNVVQEQAFAIGHLGVWSAPAYWNGNVYYWGINDVLKAFVLSNSLLSTKPTQSAEQYGFPGATPSISANGSSQGIVWSIDSEAYQTPGPAILQAHNASNVASTLYSSSTNATRDAAGNAVKFTVPTIANGKVYVGAAAEVDIYGLLSGTSQVSAPTFSPGTESFSGSVTVSIADATPNASIYYTTDGSAATTSATLYSVPITLTSTQTLHAIATATGLVTSAQASATYTNSSQANAVVFSLPTGTYTSAQTLTLTDVTAGAAIRYTTDGSTPTASSTLYSGAIAINATETVTAIAIAPGVSNSPVISQTYTIAIGATGINFSSGFAASTGSVILNGSAQLNDSRLQITDGLANEAGTAWYKTPVNIQTFTNNFTFQLSNPAANGITFTIQNASAGTGALGASGSSLGYAPITNSVALKFDFTTPVGNGTDSTGLYQNGALPTTPAIDLSGTGINLLSDDVMAVQMVYDGTTLTITITDLVTSAVWTGTATVNIPSAIGSNTAYVGFTGSTSASASSQKILTWSFVSSSTLSATAMPSFSPAAGSYTGAQNVTISDSTANAVIYYTTDGSTPTTSSAIASGAVTVSSTETLKAIALASGFSSSAVATAAYTITTATATPTFSVASGTYTSTQSVTISDTTSGATIYYTTNGTTPTTSSTVYSGAITVSATETLEAIAVATGFSSSGVATAAYTITPPAATPTFSVPAGTYATARSVTISDTTSGATIYYTTNGTTPTTSSTVYSGAITVSATETVKAIAAATGFSTSAVASATYTITPAAATPTFSVPSGVYTGAQTVTISDTSPSPTIFYTTNGTTPTTTSPVYLGPINVSSSTTINAIAVAPGFSTSAMASNWYTISPPAATPVFSVAGGTYTSAQSVTISDATSGAAIYYTTNGVTPTTSSTRYSGAITVSASETLEAIAVATGFTNSAVATAAYQITPPAATPTFGLPGGTYSTAQTLTLSDTTSGAAIYYTTNGTTPTTASTKYSGAITVSASETVEAIAVATGFTNSAVATATYQIGPGPVATPIFSLPAGTYSTQVTVAISDASAGAKIYYTHNGTTPTNKSTLYSGPFLVGNSATVQAIAYASDGSAASPVASATYTLSNAAPVFNPPSGTYPGPLTVTITSATPSAKIAYTPNGSNPTVYAVYTGPITLTASGKVFALAYQTGFTNSATVGAVYTIQPTAAAPVFSVPSGTYTTAQTVSISDATAGASIHYTTNGTTPTSASPLYSGPIPIGITATLQAIAYAPNDSPSAVASATYTLNAAAPVFNPPSGTYASPLTVTITSATPTAQIAYTPNGNAPTVFAAYSGPITMTASGTVYALAQQTGYTSSPTVSAVYTVLPGTATPVLSLPSGTYTGTQTVTISDATPGAKIYYTHDGTTPTNKSTLYSGPFLVGNSATVQAIAYAAGNAPSSIAAATYTLSAAAPVFNPPSGTYPGPLTVTITSATPAAGIAYTPNGSNPTVYAVYTGPITMAASGKVFALAYKTGYTTSNATGAVYTIEPAAATPLFSLAAGSYTGAQTVTISDATPGATVYYTTDGTAPTTSSLVYSGAITVAASETVRAIVAASGFSNSAAGTAAYTIQ